MIRKHVFVSFFSETIATNPYVRRAGQRLEQLILPTTAARVGVADCNGHLDDTVPLNIPARRQKSVCAMG